MYKNLSVKIKLLISIFFVAAIITIFITYQTVNSINKMADKRMNEFHNQFLTLKKESIKNHVEMASGILQLYRDKVTQKTTPEQLKQIKKDAIKALDSMTFGKDGYIFIWTYEGVPLAIKPRPHLIGKSLIHLKDGDGRDIVKEHINNAKKGGGHYHIYKWKTTKDSPYQTKISYSFGVQDWQWLVGTGEYFADEEKLLKEKKEEIKQSTDSLILNTIYSVSIFFLFMGVIFYIIVQKMIDTPINMLAKGLNQFFLFLQNKTNKVEKIELKVNDEFGVMIDSINKNIQTSVALHEQIKDLNDNLEEKVKEKTQKLKLQAITDNLTQLYNRNKLDEVLILESNRANRFKDTFGVILFDIDYFKNVNDIYGHQTGDRVLKEFADIIKTNSRKTDTVGRWGGEEFLIICSGTNLEGTITLARHLKEKISTHSFSIDEQKTASFGVTVYKDNEEINELIKRADEALYKAKENGRDRIEFK